MTQPKPKITVGSRWVRKRDKVVVVVDGVSPRGVSFYTAVELLSYSRPVAEFRRNFRPEVAAEALA